MEEFISYLVRNLVEKPDEVKVVCTGDDPVRVDIHCAKTDIARVIGRQGRTIQALRTLATTAGARLGHRVRLDVVEDKEEPAAEQPAAEQEPATEPQQEQSSEN